MKVAAVFACVVGLIAVVPGRALSGEATVSGASSSTGHPWELSGERRAALRRSSLEAAFSSRAGNSGSAVVRGRTNPEFFYPTELFEHFAATAFSPNASTRTIARESLLETAVALGIGSDVWTLVAPHARPVVEANERQRALALAILEKDSGRQKLLDESASLEAHRCELLTSGLKRAEESLGGTLLLRLLYLGVAPTVTMTVSPDTDLEIFSRESECRR